MFLDAVTAVRDGHAAAARDGEAAVTADDAVAAGRDGVVVAATMNGNLSPDSDAGMTARDGGIRIRNYAEGESLVILQVNCRSIYNKTVHFWNMVESYNVDVVIGTESWLNAEILNAEIFRPHFLIFRRDRVDRIGGGVFICIKDNFEAVEAWVDDKFEIIGVDIRDRNSKNQWEIIGVYRPQQDGHEPLQRLIERTRVIRKSGKNVIIGGDLNLPHVSWEGDVGAEGAAQRLINELVWENGLTQVVTKPTRDNALLDVFLIRPADQFLACEVIPGISDHKGVLLKMCREGKRNDLVKEREIFQFSRTNVTNMQLYLKSNFPAWASSGCTVEQIWSNFKNIISECLAKFVPTRKLRCHSDPVYYNKEVRRLKRQVRKAYSKRNINKDQKNNFLQLSKDLLALKLHTQENYLKSILSDRLTCWQNFFKYVRHKKGNKESIPAICGADGSLITDDSEKAACLNRHYSSVFKPKDQTLVSETTPVIETFRIDGGIIRKRIAKIRRNKSVGPDGIPGEILKLGGEAMIPYLARLMEVTVNNSMIPQNWKEAVVVPIHKGGDRRIVNNYRPISLTSVVCKQMEHIIAEYIRRVWNKTDWLFQNQHGFRPGYSCDSQTIAFCQDIADSLDEGSRVDAIILDFSKAFDLVPHGLLISKLSETGIDHRIILWIKEFLTGRTQTVRIGDKYSSKADVTSGVPQGSVLGPLLFLAFINDIATGLKSKVRLFADDCIIYRSIGSSEDENVLQSDLNCLWNWACRNKMELNPEKSKFICFTKSRSNVRSSYELGTNVIPRVKNCKYLGLVLRSDLGWSDHINNTVKKSWRALHFVMRILKNSSPNARSLAYTTLVRPILEYGAACWDPYRKGQIEALDKIQKRASKFVNHGCVGDEREEWESLSKRRERARLCVMYKTYRGDTAWADIGKRLQKSDYKSRGDHPWKIRCRKQRTDVGKFSFVNRTIVDWNKLPAEALEALPSNVAKFKNMLHSI